MEKIFLLFILYSVLGFIIEVVLNLITKKRFINRGFLIGPYCPIYGVGSLLIIFLLDKYRNDILVLFILITLICSILEYVTSYLMEKIFHIRWWDYSNHKYNINGRICLSTMIPFGLGGVLLITYLNPFILSLIDKVPNNLVISCVVILLIVFITDILLSFNIILGLKNITTNIKSDSTEKVTIQVKKKIKETNKALYNRLIYAFPKLQIFKRK